MPTKHPRLERFTGRVHFAVVIQPFIRRLCDGTSGARTLKKICWASYFFQLKSLYEALEINMARFPESKALAIFRNAPWNKRAELLRQDLQEMLLKLSVEENQFVLIDLQPAFKKLIEEMKEYNVTELYACAAVNYLGDVYGGVILGRAFKKIFRMESRFYADVEKHQQPLTKAVNQAALGDERLAQATAERTYEAYEDCLFAMERKMQEAAPAFKALEKQATYDKIGFFTGVATLVATVAAGYAMVNS